MIKTKDLIDSFPEYGIIQVEEVTAKKLQVRNDVGALGGTSGDKTSAAAPSAFVV